VLKSYSKPNAIREAPQTPAIISKRPQQPIILTESKKKVRKIQHGNIVTFEILQPSDHNKMLKIEPEKMKDENEENLLKLVYREMPLTETVYVDAKNEEAISGQMIRKQQNTQTNFQQQVQGGVTNQNFLQNIQPNTSENIHQVPNSKFKTTIQQSGQIHVQHHGYNILQTTQPNFSKNVQHPNIVQNILQVPNSQFKIPQQPSVLGRPDTDSRKVHYSGNNILQTIRPNLSQKIQQSQESQLQGPLRPVGPRGPIAVPNQVQVHERSDRQRAVIGPESTNIFEDAFKENPYPDRMERTRLGIQTNLTPRQVQIWFQNKRSSMKKIAQQKK